MIEYNIVLNLLIVWLFDCKLDKTIETIKLKLISLLRL